MAYVFHRILRRYFTESVRLILKTSTYLIDDMKTSTYLIYDIKTSTYLIDDIKTGIPAAHNDRLNFETRGKKIDQSKIGSYIVTEQIIMKPKSQVK